MGAKRNSNQVYERLYAEHTARKSAQKKLEIQILQEQVKETPFAPARITKSKDKQYGLKNEPCIDKFDRLHKDHVEKDKRRRRAKKERDELLSRKSSIVSRLSSANSRSPHRPESSSHQIKSPE